MTLYVWHRQSAQAKALLAESGLKPQGTLIEIMSPADLADAEGALLVFENHPVRCPPPIEALAQRLGLVFVRMSTIARLRAARNLQKKAEPDAQAR